LLWRIQNGELPETLQPSVFWVAIGTQDLGLTFCSPELVIIGVLRVVEEILLRTRSSEVVINAILPRTFNKEGYVAKGGSVKPSLWEDIKVVNYELKLYATYRSRVSFFDSTNTYLEDPKAPTAELKIDENLMDDFFHLTKKGYQRWASEASDKLQKMIALPHRNSTQQTNQEEDKQEFFRDDDW
jgi:lysophospholipase L1-like esterase